MLSCSRARVILGTRVDFGRSLVPAQHRPGVTQCILIWAVLAMWAGAVVQGAAGALAHHKLVRAEAQAAQARMKQQQLAHRRAGSAARTCQECPADAQRCHGPAAELDIACM